MKLRAQGRTVHHSQGQLSLEFPIVDARELGETLLVLCDYMSFPRDEPAKNLFAYNRHGKLLWRVEDIGFGAVDAYTNILAEEPLIVGNFAGFECAIDLATGRVLRKDFTK